MHGGCLLSEGGWVAGVEKTCLLCDCQTAIPNSLGMIWSTHVQKRAECVHDARDVYRKPELLNMRTKEQCLTRTIEQCAELRKNGL